MEATPVHRRARRPAAETPYWLQATGTPGLTVALLEGGKTREVLCFGSTDAERKMPVTEATVFQAASLSKQAFLYAVLKTVEADKLDLERPLSQYNDGVKAFAALVPPRGRGIVALANGAGGQRINREWVHAWLETDLPAFFFKSVQL
jgi:CubicO group peptidase (beta-lactamase class C family)